MSQLNDFNAEKVNVNSIYGGLRASNDTATIVYQGTEICEVKSDGPDADSIPG